MSRPRILIACIGNIFLGDDAFGVEVARQLMPRSWPEGVRVVDFGIRGLDLTYALLENCDVAILVDAVPRGHAPGTLYVIEAEIESGSEEPAAGISLLDAHGMDPVKVLNAVALMGGKLQRVLVIGCEPMPFNSDEEMQMALSPEVEAAVPRAVELVESLVGKILAGDAIPTNPESFTKGDVTHVHPQSII